MQGFRDMLTINKFFCFLRVNFVNHCYSEAIFTNNKVAISSEYLKTIVKGAVPRVRDFLYLSTVFVYYLKVSVIHSSHKQEVIIKLLNTKYRLSV